MGHESIDVMRMAMKRSLRRCCLPHGGGFAACRGERPAVAVYYLGLPWHLRYQLEGVVED